MTRQGEKANAKTVLIVDDDEAIRFLFKFALERKGYRAFIASNGQEGLELLAVIPRPDMILLDLMMPIMDGWTFLEAIESDERWRTIPLLILTAFPVDSAAVKGKLIFHKPVELHRLLEAVDNCCE